MDLNQVKETIQYHFPFTPSLSCIRNILKELKITRKQFTKGIVSKNQDVLKEQRNQFLATLQCIPNEKIICIDETGFCNQGNVVKVWYPKGKYPKNTSYVKRREKYSVCVAISHSSILCYQKQVKPFDKVHFVKFLNELIPKIPTNVEYVIMDNVAFHKSKEVRELIQSVNLKTLFIPPYTPRCNPIEEVFSLVKRNFRRNYSSERFESCVVSEFEKEYKDFSHYYNHTRRYEP
jgi:transposase